MSETEMTVTVPAPGGAPTSPTSKLSARVEPVTRWVRRTWQPTQDQIDSAARAVQQRLQKGVTKAGDRVRAALGGPTTEVLADMNRRLTRIETRLESLGSKDPKEKRGA